MQDAIFSWLEDVPDRTPWQDADNTPRSGLLRRRLTWHGQVKPQSGGRSHNAGRVAEKANARVSGRYAGTKIQMLIFSLREDGLGHKPWPDAENPGAYIPASC